MPPRRSRRWLDVAAVYAVILASSMLPGDALAGTPGWSAVVGHAAGYGLLAGTIHRAVSDRSAGLTAIVLAVVLGVLNELQQGAVAGRSPDVTDVAVDGVGALAGVVVRGAWLRRRVGRHPATGRVRPRRPAARPPAPTSAGRR